MANSQIPFFYYRTDSTPVSNPTYADPDDLPPNQKLYFEGVGEEVADEFEIHHKNSIGGSTIPQTDGTSKTALEHLGRAFQRRNVKGYLRDINEELKLLAFANTAQQEGVHEFGRFGLYHPTRTSLRIDPTLTVGVLFDELKIKHTTREGSVSFFDANILIDGTLVIPLP